MRIDDLNLSATVNTLTNRAAESHASAPVSGSREGAGKAQGGTDKVELSFLAGQLSRTLAVDSASRAARVSQLAKLYQAGGYRPDPAATAQAMVQDALGASGPAGA